MDLLLRPDGLRYGSFCEAISKPWVLVLDGRVAHCDARPPDGIPEGIPAIRGGWLLEPLSDAHAHLFLPGSLDPADQRRVARLPDDEALSRILQVLEAYRRAGVAAIRDGGDPRGLALWAARVANRNPGRYAIVLPAGEPLFRRGRYGSFLGAGVDTLEAAAELMRRNCREGATHAKILATGINSLEEAGKVGSPQFTPGEISLLRAEARELGVPLMVHANGPLGVAGCLPGSEGTLEHGFWLEDSDLESLARDRTPWVPTLGAWEALASRDEGDARGREVIAATAVRHRCEVERGWGLGVPVLCGTDAGSPGVSHSRALVGEIQRLSELVGGPAGALAASSHGARTLCEEEMGTRLGGLEAGGPAGFLWLDQDPVLDPAGLLAPRGVYLGGVWSADAAQVSSEVYTDNTLK